MGGMKDDVGKPPLSWLAMHWPALGDVARVTAFGAKKYKPDNWMEGIEPRLLYDAMARHMFRAMAGEREDHESEEDHLAHVAWNALTLIMYKKIGLHNGPITRKVLTADGTGDGAVVQDVDSFGLTEPHGPDKGMEPVYYEDGTLSREVVDHRWKGCEYPDNPDLQQMPPC